MANPVENLANRKLAHDLYKQKLRDQIAGLDSTISNLDVRIAEEEDRRDDDGASAAERLEAIKEREKLINQRNALQQEQGNLKSRLRFADAQALGSMASRGAGNVRSVASSGTRAVKATGSAIGKPVKATYGVGKSIVGATAWGVSSVFTINVFFFFAFAIYLIDVLVLQLNRSPGDPIVMGMYGLLVLLGIFTYGLHPKAFVWLMGLAAWSAFLLPWLLQFVKGTPLVHSVLEASVLLFPVWLIFIWRTAPPDTFAFKWSGIISKLAIIAIFIFILVVAMRSYGESPALHPDFQFKRAFQLIWDPVWDGFKMIFGGLWKIPTAIKDFVQHTISSAYYVGQVEENTDAPLGVYIDRFRALDKELYPDMDIYLLAEVSAASLKGNVSIATSCYAQSTSDISKLKENAPKAVAAVTPKLIFVEQKTIEAVECKFGKNWLKPGSYTATFEAEFNFETWAYAEYSFMDYALYRSYTAQNKDINTEYGIPEQVTAIYTNGPVMIGTQQIYLPARIDTTAPEDWSMPFGVTVENQWRDGEVKQVTEYIIQLPKELEFQGACNRGTPVNNTNNTAKKDIIEGYTPYSVKVPVDINSKWDTLQCRLKLAGGSNPEKMKDSMQSLLGGNPIARRTIAVQVKYDYILKNEIALNVLKPEGYVEGEVPIEAPTTGMNPADNKKISTWPGASAEERKVIDIWNTFGGYISTYAAKLKIEPAIAVAVFAAESGGNGFEGSRMIIRFENYRFYDNWGKSHQSKYDDHFSYGSPVWTNQKWRSSTSGSWVDVHAGQDREWAVFEFAKNLDKNAAMKSISMGLPQILGSNYALAGYSSVQEMFDSFSESEANQVTGFFRFINRPTMTSPLQQKDFTAFAAQYNGAGNSDAYGKIIKNYYDKFNSVVASSGIIIIGDVTGAVDAYPNSVSVTQYLLSKSILNTNLEKVLLSNSQPRTTTVQYIILHHTAGASATSSLETLGQTGLSAHYLVAKDGAVILVVPESKVASHAGCASAPEKCLIDNMNSKSIGIEIDNCGVGSVATKDCAQNNAPSGIDVYPPVQVNAVNNLVKYLIQKYNINGQTNVVGHGCVTLNKLANEPIGFPAMQSTWQLLRRGADNSCQLIV
ncbi:MAG: N-acetylmuramidase domain-containing protein [Candidatus Woesearchaeota archaeon]